MKASGKKLQVFTVRGLGMQREGGAESVQVGP